MNFYTLFCAAFAIKCKICVSSNSMADCMATEQTVDCASIASQLGFTPDRCVKMSVDYEEAGGVQFKSFAKTCYSQELCEKGDTWLQQCRNIDGETCELDCCSTDNCNGGTAPLMTIF